ncbi:MAG: chemotaxis protein CheX [Thermodesulfobacteriota bacterium]
MELKAELVNPFLSATVHVLKTMVNLTPVVGKPYIKKESSTRGDISGIVGIIGDTEGSLCLTFSKNCILYIVSKLFGEEQQEINEEVKDAVGELTNMISGDARRRLEEIGYHFQGAVPSVVSGPNHEIKHITKGPILAIPFSTLAGNFIVEICFKGAK